MICKFKELAIFVFVIVVCQLSNYHEVEGVIKMSFTKPEDILKLEEITIVQLKSVWNLTHDTYTLWNQPGTNTTGRIKTFWNSLKSTLAVATNMIRAMDKEIIASQPSSLLNKLIGLQELDTLKEVSDTLTDDPVTHWKVKWVEVSSLATHIHWLFNKRLRDIMNNVPYIKTIALSLAKYYGNPWYSKLSGRKDDAHRYPIKDFPRWIVNRTFSTPKGDLFYGLRQMIDNCKTCKSGSSVRKDSCLGNETLAEIDPVRLDAPVYVFFYLALVDIKYYILKNFFHIYREVYENIPYTAYGIFDERLHSRTRNHLEAFLNSFKGYDGFQNLSTKVTKGIFHCDPPPVQVRQNKRAHVYKETFIKLTNLATDFVILERDITPLGTCSNTCKDLGKADVEPCRKSDEECEAELSTGCDSNPRLCELFKPKCPLADLVCYKSGTSAEVCPSTAPDRVIEWAIFNDTDKYPKGHNANCSLPMVKYRSTIIRDPVTNKMETCEVCLCQCFEPLEIHGSADSVRIFSQKESLALVDQNRVIVGIKFEQVDNQIHIMIADAVSLPGLVIDKSTITWRQPIRADEGNPNEVIRIGRNLRAMLLDDWTAAPGFVVTGVRFVPDEVGSPNSADYQTFIAIKLKVTKVDVSTGNLLLAESNWITTTSSGPKSTYSYSSPDDPTKAEGPALPDSSLNQLVYFRSMALAKTNANGVIPYFDTQKVVPEKSVGLKGVGIYHKMKPGYGGFIGWKLMI